MPNKTKFEMTLATFILGLSLFGYVASAKTTETPFAGNWAVRLPDGSAAWLTFYEKDGMLDGEIWTVGASNGVTDIRVDDDTLYFKRNCAVGDPPYPGGAPTGNKVSVQYHAKVEGDRLDLFMERPLENEAIESLPFVGKRMPPLPPKPDLSKVKYGNPIQLFNGKDLTGWRLTNPNQISGWRAEDGVLINETPKLSFEPFSRYGNLRTEREFMDFNLKLEFNVPVGGNSGVYLRGLYEVQVVDRDSRLLAAYGFERSDINRW